MVSDIDTVLSHAQAVVIGNKDPEFRRVPECLSQDQVLIDFVRVLDKRSEAGQYDGICW
jgi:GDP-mannose 6-dehydrogenase